MKIAILLFDEVDLLDAGGPYEVFLTASRLACRNGSPAPFDVVTVSLDGEPVGAFGGLGLVPRGSLASVMPVDALIIPGTINVDKALADRALLDAIAGVVGAIGDRPEPVLASVCTGAFLLAGAGLLGGREWTTHWEDIDSLAARLGADGAKRDVRWVDTGAIVTSAGLSSGIAMSLHLVDRFAGRALAERTARQIDYRWDPEGVDPGR